MSCPICSCRNYKKPMEESNGYWICGCGYAIKLAE